MNIDRQIEFDKVKNIWADLAITDWARERISEASIYYANDNIRM